MKEQTFVTNGSGSYAFDTIVTGGDYDRPLTETEWDRSNQKKIQIYTPAEWQERISGIISSTGVFRYARARGGNLIMTPDESGDTLVFEYISNFYAVPAGGGSPKATYTADDDTSKFPEFLLKLGLKFYLKTEYGLPAEEDGLRYYDMADSLLGRDGPTKVIRPPVNPRKSDFILNVPDSGVGQ